MCDIKGNRPGWPDCQANLRTCHWTLTASTFIKSANVMRGFKSAGEHFNPNNIL
jgi:hypothetical protein